jgi:hypothetical protein
MSTTEEGVSRPRTTLLYNCGALSLPNTPDLDSALWSNHAALRATLRCYCQYAYHFPASPQSRSSNSLLWFASSSPAYTPAAISSCLRSGGTSRGCASGSPNCHPSRRGFRTLKGYHVSAPLSDGNNVAFPTSSFALLPRRSLISIYV